MAYYIIQFHSGYISNDRPVTLKKIVSAFPLTSATIERALQSP